MRGGSYLSSHDPRLHFGLGTLPLDDTGSETIPEIRVRWPGEGVATYHGLAPRRTWILQRGEDPRVEEVQ